MDDALFVRSLERFTDARCNTQGLVERNRPAPDAFRQCFAFNQFEYEKARTFRLFETVNRRNVRMIERRENFGFALEPAQALRVAREFLGQNLDGDFALEIPVACSI